MPAKKKKTNSVLNRVFGHDQNAIEGFKDCEGDMQESLNLERTERDAATEFEGAVKTEKKGRAQKSNDDDGKYPEERPLLDSQEADSEDEEHSRRPEFKEMDPDLLEKANKLFQRIKATIKVIPRSIMERGKVVVETAVRNDVRPDASLASNDTSSIYNDKEGKAYGVKGATSSLHLVQAFGPPPLVVALPVPWDYANQAGNKFRGKFKWTIIDDQWVFPDASLECAPLLREIFMGGADDWHRKAWEHGSRILNAVLRHSDSAHFEKGGWVNKRLRKTYKEWGVEQIASVHWLFGLLHDAGPTVKSRFQLAGVVDGAGVMVRICYVRCKSGHNKRVADLIPSDSIYTKIEEKHLHLISCICHKTKFENIKSIFLNGLIPGGNKSPDNRAHSNFTPFPPFDNRNIAPGRLAGECDVVIVFNNEKLMKYDLRMSMSAILVTDAHLPWSTIVGFRNFIAFFGTRPWRDEILIVSPRLGGRNINFNPGIEILVVEILIVSPRLGGRNINFNPGIETLESRLWRACPVPGLFPMPGLCRLRVCFFNVYSITSWSVIIC